MARGQIIFGIAGCVLGMAAATAGLGYSPQQDPPPAVAKDLDAAMRGEAFAFAKYMLYAEEARAHGHPEIAALFEKTANTERLEHFREHAQLAGLTSRSDAANLRDAIAGESYETTDMYPQMAARARQAGDTAAGTRFTEIGKDEGRHRDAFAAALRKLEERPK